MIARLCAVGLLCSSLDLAATSAEAASRGELRQLNRTLAMSGEPVGLRRFSARLQGGGVRVRGLARNNADDRTVELQLTFTYPVFKGFVFDEILSRIEVSSPADFVRVSGGDSGIVLVPNGLSLHYRLTLYRPGDGVAYTLRVRVFGNYE